ncbi:tRNA (guanosine(46)-N7)-methyltransferase TrmB [Thermodesulfobacteriota bacterium]
MRMRGSSGLRQRYEEEKERDKIVLVDDPDSTEPLDWRELFGNDGSVVVEVGFGKGRTLIAMAGERPAMNFLGIETSWSYLLLTRERVIKAGLSNVRLLFANAAWIFTERIIPGSISECYILFPDPWPKKRHHKKRIFREAFVTNLARALGEGGRVHVATDSEAYLEVIRPVLDSSESLHCLEERIIGSDDDEEDDQWSHFQIKYLRQGRTIHSMVYEKVSS